LWGFSGDFLLSSGTKKTTERTEDTKNYSDQKKLKRILNQTDKHNKVKINIRSKIAQNRKGELK